jgi:hypothetical protein
MWYLAKCSLKTVNKAWSKNIDHENTYTGRHTGGKRPESEASAA